MNTAVVDEIAAEVDRLRPRCPLCQLPLVGDPLSYAVHGTQGYRGKCRSCGTRVVMAWAPLGRAVKKLAR